MASDVRQCPFRQRLRCGRAPQVQKRAFCSCGACGCAPQTPSIDTHDQRGTTANHKTAGIRHSTIPRHCGLETGHAPQVQNSRYCSCGAHDGHPHTMLGSPAATQPGAKPSKSRGAQSRLAHSEAKRPLHAPTTSPSITQRSQPGNYWPNHFTENAQRSQTATTCPNSFTENAVSEVAMTSTGRMTSLSQLSEAKRPPPAQPTSSQTLLGRLSPSRLLLPHGQAHQS